MKKTFLISTFLLICLFGFSQNAIFDKTKPIHIDVSKAAIKSPTAILTRITVNKDNKEAYTIKLKTNNKTEEFTIKPLIEKTFSLGFKKAFTDLTQNIIDENQTNLSFLFIDILISRTEEVEAPLAGILHVENSIDIGWLVEQSRKVENNTYIQSKIIGSNEYKLNKHVISSDENIKRLIYKENSTISKSEIKRNGTIENLSKIDQLQFKPRKTQIEFSEGYIRNITIEGSIFNKNDTTDVLFKEAFFKNKIPIGFSSIHDLDKFKNLNLTLYSKRRNIDVEIPLSYFLCYHPNLRINTRDYCPENGVINIEHPNNEIKLYKEKAANILTARVFSDILGMQEDNPNGIIQTEVEKRINIWTRRFKLPLGANWGFLQYAKPYVVLSKVEKQNRYLELEKQNKKDTLKINSLDLFQHEAFRVGTDINLITFDGVSAKSTICWDMGVAFSKVIVSDTTTIETAESNKTHINNLNLYTKANFRLFPDERYGISFSYQLSYYSPLNHGIELLQIKEERDNKNWLQSMEMMAFLKTGDAGKVFFRYRLNSSLTNWDHNFAQVQLGYSFDITKQIK